MNTDIVNTTLMEAFKKIVSKADEDEAFTLIDE